MAFDIASIDSSINAGRESVLGWINLVPDNTQLKLGFLVLAAVMAIILLKQFSQGQEERKGIYGTLAIVVLCFSIIFGFRLMLISWIVLFILGLELSKKLKQADSKGAGMIVVVMCVLAYILSVNILMMTTIVGGTLALGWAAKKANSNAVFGRGEGAKVLGEQGYPVTKERRILRALGRIARKGARWTRDKMVSTAALLKRRFAERALKNEAEQLRQAEIVAAGEKFSKELYRLEYELEKLEEGDAALIQKIMQQCKDLEAHLNNTAEQALETEGKEEIRKRAHEILKDAHKLVAQKMEEERLTKAANTMLEQCMEIIHHSAREAGQLEEHKAAFKEMKNAAISNINAMRKEIQQEERDLKHSISNTKGEGASERIGLMKKREAGLANVAAKLANIEEYLVKIDNILIKITAKEDARINEVRRMSEEAKRHAEKLHEESKLFSAETKALSGKYKQFSHIFESEKGMIADSQLDEVNQGTSEMFNLLNNLIMTSKDYHEKELLPLIQNMANVAQNVSHLAQVSEDLTKMYFRLSQAHEALTKIAAELDQNPESKKQLQQIWQAEEFEEKIIKRAYKGGKSVVFHIKYGYQYLQMAYELVKKHVGKLQTDAVAVKEAKERINSILRTAFDRMLGKEIKAEKKMEGLAGEAQHRAHQAGRDERLARGQ